MTVHFIGAGPGDPELITVRGLKLIQSCKLCLYAGSLVPEAVVEAAPSDATVIDTASLTLDDIINLMVDAHAAGHDVARVHSGDPSLYGAIAEQIRRLKALDIDYKIVPGVSAYAAAAAGLGIELTIPEVTQSLILTRTAMKSSQMPAGEELTSLGRTGATLAIHLSIRNLRQIERDLTPFYGADCPVIVAYRVGWPDEAYLHATLSSVHKAVQKEKITRTALIFVGKGLNQDVDFRDSALYDADHVHVLRPKRGRASDLTSEG
ncbi:precorrin-4 C(11)-methyltransferase [Alphaproteobacteria bacterium]|jgi:precorrin-4/cobalt-precorrin-4 C11-methyltransferase|nr:precorrin-4 C(11)-methyltransferase [Alphaproteobacteria bacterium]